MQNRSAEMGRMISLVSSIILAVAAFLPWGVLQATTISGINGNGDGLITIAIAVLVFLALFIKRIPIAVTLVLGLIGLTVSIVTFIQIGNAANQTGAEIGIGIYLSILAALGIVIGTVYYWKCIRKEPLTGTIISIIAGIIILAGVTLSPTLLPAVPTIITGVGALGVGIIVQILQDKHSKKQLFKEV